MTAEQSRLEEVRTKRAPWKLWGPYLSERQWGTVREDYSEGGDAWNYFPHDQARSRAYRWGEDGLAGICDDGQRLCFALSMWNGKDPILKERLFGLTNTEGNHGEDVKEYYFYLDSHADALVHALPVQVPTGRLSVRRPSPHQSHAGPGTSRSTSCIDTGVFDQDRYFDVFVEYAKASPEDILIRCTVHNRGPDSAILDLLPRLWFRNEWSWHADAKRPSLAQVADRTGDRVIRVDHPLLGTRYLYCEGDVPLLFTENETNSQRIFGVPEHVRLRQGRDQRLHCPRPRRRSEPGEDRDHRRGPLPVDHRSGRVPGGAPAAVGCGACYARTRSSVLRRTVRRRLRSPGVRPPSAGGGRVLRRNHSGRRSSADDANVMRQALAGMLWSKQYYRYDVHQWLKEHGSDPFNPTRKAAPRNDRWHHMYNADVISMPDKWEYPWYAAWDLAFHVLGTDAGGP